MQTLRRTIGTFGMSLFIRGWELILSPTELAEKYDLAFMDSDSTADVDTGSHI
jgi:hypothetical protein